MASNKVVRIGPVAMSNAATNIVNPPTLSGGTGLSGVNTNTYLIIKHIRLVNKTAGAVSATLYIGATGGSAAGTEFWVNGTSIPANQGIDFYGNVRLDVTDFLTGLAGAATSITFEAEAEIGVV